MLVTFLLKLRFLHNHFNHHIHLHFNTDLRIPNGLTDLLRQTAGSFPASHNKVYGLSPQGKKEVKNAVTNEI